MTALALLLPLLIHAAETDSLHVRTISDLWFGVAVQGDPPQTVPAGTSENGRNASFIVDGRPNQAYSILLPADHNLMALGAPRPSTVPITGFHSYPSGGGVIGGDGHQKFFVGATRGAIPYNAVTGYYEGNFMVVVVY